MKKNKKLLKEVTDFEIARRTGRNPFSGEKDPELYTTGIPRAEREKRKKAQMAYYPVHREADEKGMVPLSSLNDKEYEEFRAWRYQQTVGKYEEKSKSGGGGLVKVDWPQFNPTLRIRLGDDGEYKIDYGESDPLEKRSSQVGMDLNSEIDRLFPGYSNWNDYKRDNLSDLKRKIKRARGGKVVAAPTVHPFHVAYALEEFRDSVSQEQYELVGIPNRLFWDQLYNVYNRQGQFLNSLEAFGKVEESQLLEEVWIKIADKRNVDAHNQRQKRLAAIKGMEDKKAEREEINRQNLEFRDSLKKKHRDLHKLLNDEVLCFDSYRSARKLRKGFFGSDPSKLGGLLYSSMINPPEGLNNKNVINTIRNRSDLNFAEIFSSKFGGQMPVKALCGLYWTSAPEGNFAKANLTDDAE